MRKSRTNQCSTSRKDEFLMALKQKYSMKPNIENSPFRLQRNQLKIPDSPSFGYSTIPRSAGVSPLAQRNLNCILPQQSALDRKLLANAKNYETVRNISNLVTFTANKQRALNKDTIRRSRAYQAQTKTTREREQQLEGCLQPVLNESEQQNGDNFSPIKRFYEESGEKEEKIQYTRKAELTQTHKKRATLIELDRQESCKIIANVEDLLQSIRKTLTTERPLKPTE